MDDVSFQIASGEVLGLVGESGSGKSTLARLVLRLIEPSAGLVRFQRPRTSLAFRGARSTAFRQAAQIVFQNPDSSLNPRRTVGDAIARAVKLHSDSSASERRERARGPDGSCRAAARLLRPLPASALRWRKAADRHRPRSRDRPGTSSCATSRSPRSTSRCRRPSSILLSDLRTSSVFPTFSFLTTSPSWRTSPTGSPSCMRAGSWKSAPRPRCLSRPITPIPRRCLSRFRSPHPARRAAPASSSQIRRDGRAGRSQGCPFYTRCPRKLGTICETVTPPLRGVARPRIVCHIPLPDLAARHLRAAVRRYGRDDDETGREDAGACTIVPWRRVAMSRTAARPCCSSRCDHAARDHGPDREVCLFRPLHTVRSSGGATSRRAHGVS